MEQVLGVGLVDVGTDRDKSAPGIEGVTLLSALPLLPR